MQPINWSGPLLERAQQLRDRDEEMRHAVLLTIFGENTIERRFTEKQLFEAAYGDGTGAEYWETFLSEPMLPNGVASTYALHAVQKEGDYKGFYSNFCNVLMEMANDGILPELKFEEVNRRSFLIVGEKIDPSFVTEWLLSKPKRRHWVPESLARFIATLSSGQQETDRQATGMQGRPTSKHLIMAELDRRAAAGEMLGQIGKEASALSAWLASAHPNMPLVGASATENAIRARYNKIPKSHP